MTSPEALHYDSFYHIYNRGINRQDIFFEPINYLHFIHLYTRFLTNHAGMVAYCLLRNHFHMLIRVKREEDIQVSFRTQEVNGVARTIPTPSRCLSDFFNAYAKGINARYGRTGSLFQHPFGRKLILSDTRLWTVIAYIHQNPQKHHFVSDFRDWPYSSFKEIIGDQPTFLPRQEILDWFGGMESYINLNRQWVEDANEKWHLDDTD